MCTVRLSRKTNARVKEVTPLNTDIYEYSLFLLYFSMEKADVCQRQIEFEFARPITGRRRIMAITLKKATREDIETIWKMQVEAFTELLDKYQDFDMSPATESLEKIIAKFEQPWTTYYYIVENDIVVGAVRIVNKNDGSRKRISPIWIMGEFRNKGYAQQAMIELENIYGSDHWCLDTILQEKGNLHLYEKMGYVQTGKVEHINEKMDIVFYEKN